MSAIAICRKCGYPFNNRVSNPRKCPNPKCQAPNPLGEGKKNQMDDLIIEAEEQAVAAKSETHVLMESIKLHIPPEPALRHWSQLGRDFVSKVKEAIA